MFGTRTLTDLDNQPVKADLVVSALQKEIRRGSFRALNWALTLLKNGYYGACFNRLFVITMEDASPHLRLPEVIEALYEEGKAALKGKKMTDSKDVEVCKTTLIKAVLHLVDTPKSRCLNHLLALARMTLVDEIMTLAHEAKERSVQDVSHVLYGSVNDFKAALTESLDKAVVAGLRILIWNHKPSVKSMWTLLRKTCLPEHAASIKALEKWTKQSAPLALAHAIMLVRSDIPLPFDKNAISAMSQQRIADALEELRLAGRIEVPDYAIDKHTADGKRLGRGIQHFYAVGAVVEKEAFPDPWVAPALEAFEKFNASKSTAPAKLNNVKFPKWPAQKSTAVQKFIRICWVILQMSPTTETHAHDENSSEEDVDNANANADDEKNDPDATESDEEEEKKVSKKRTKETQDLRRAIDDISSDEDEEEVVEQTKKPQEEGKKKRKKYPAPVNPINDLHCLEMGIVESICIDPFTVLKNPIYTQIPCGRKPPALIGKYSLEHDQWSNRMVFLKGPVTLPQAISQWFCSHMKLIMGDQMVDPMMDTEAEGQPIEGQVQPQETELPPPGFDMRLLNGIPTRILRFGEKFYILMLNIMDDLTTAECEWNNQKIAVLKPSTAPKTCKTFQEYLRQTKTALSPEVIRQYLCVILFRQFWGISDTCNRNIIIRDELVYSIDELVCGKPLCPWVWHVSKAFQATLCGWIKENRAFCSSVIDHWVGVLEDKENVALLKSPDTVKERAQWIKHKIMSDEPNF